jgi:hypothetical protein
VFSLDKYGAFSVQYVTGEKRFVLACIIRVNTALRQLLAGVQRPLLWFTCRYSLHSALGSVERVRGIVSWPFCGPACAVGRVMLTVEQK